MGGRKTIGRVWVGVFLVAPSVTAAYPAGPVVSTGTNPIASYGGEVLGASSLTLLTAPADQDFVITDVNLTPRFDSVYCRAVVGVQFTLSPGDTIAQYQLGWDIGYNSNTNQNPSQIDSHMVSGWRVPAGSALQMTVVNRYILGCGTWGVNYTLAGYHSEP